MTDPKTPLDLTAAAVAAGTILDLLPALASLLTIIWMALRIYESATIQRWLGRDQKGQSDE